MSVSEAVAIIPAYNEERTIGPVVRAALRADLISGLVVVDDGSRDRTASAAMSAIHEEGSTKSAMILGHVFNQGKAEAVLTGVGTAHDTFIKPGEGTVVLLDADLSPVWSRLTPENMKLTQRLLQWAGVENDPAVLGTEEDFIIALAGRINQLARPVLEGAPMSIGMVQRNKIVDWARLALDWGVLAGNRAVRADVLEQMLAESRDKRISISGWELEAALNTFTRKRRDEHGTKLNRGIQKFLWDDVVNVGSRAKEQDLVAGLKRMAHIHGRAVLSFAKYAYHFS